MIAIRSITFNVDPSHADGTVTLRRNASTTVDWPEWQAGRSNSPEDSPVCFSLADLGNRIPAVVVRLSRSIGDPDRFELRALAPPIGGPPLPPAYLPQPQLLWPVGTWFPTAGEYSVAAAYQRFYDQWQDSRRLHPSPIGAIAPIIVDFPAGQTDVSVVVPLGEQRLRGRGVGVHDIVFQWQARSSALTAWHNITSTAHRVYVILQRPTLPWTERPVGIGNTQLPWTEALDVACRWADGAVTPRAAGIAISNALNSLGSAMFEYGCPIGALTMYGSVFGLDAFDLTAFLERIDGGLGNGRYVNCTDCATIVSTLANLVGCDLWQSRMGLLEPPFETNPIQAIGTLPYQSPCGWGLGFTYHEVAWTGGCGVDDRVYDACVRVVDEPAGRAPTTSVPADLRFGEPGSGGYRDLLAAPASAAFCVPRPADRKRRAVV